MIIFKADPARRIEIAGVAARVRRPIDIDQAATGFANLRTLRIYQFDAGSVIDGHAEEDEVFIVVLAGRVDLTMISDLWEDSQQAFTLSAANESEGVACAAYLPPHAAYKLIPQGDADVAYVRATPESARRPKIFSAIRRQEQPGIIVLLDAFQYAERLRMRFVQIDATQTQVTFAPLIGSEAPQETMVHLRSDPQKDLTTAASAGGTLTSLQSWDTIAFPSGAHPNIEVAGGPSLVLVVSSV